MAKYYFVETVHHDPTQKVYTEGKSYDLKAWKKAQIRSAETAGLIYLADGDEETVDEELDFDDDIG